MKASLSRKARTTWKDLTASYICADISFPMMAFNETFGDRIINLLDSPDGDSHFFFLYFMSFKSKKGSLLPAFTG